MAIKKIIQEVKRKIPALIKPLTYKINLFTIDGKPISYKLLTYDVVSDFINNYIDLEILEGVISNDDYKKYLNVNTTLLVNISTLINNEEIGFETKGAYLIDRHPDIDLNGRDTIRNFKLQIVNLELRAKLLNETNLVTYKQTTMRELIEGRVKNLGNNFELYMDKENNINKYSNVVCPEAPIVTMPKVLQNKYGLFYGDVSVFARTNKDINNVYVTSVFKPKEEEDVSLYRIPEEFPLSEHAWTTEDERLQALVDRGTMIPDVSEYMSKHYDYTFQSTDNAVLANPEINNGTLYSDKSLSNGPIKKVVNDNICVINSNYSKLYFFHTQISLFNFDYKILTPGLSVCLYARLPDNKDYKFRGRINKTHMVYKSGECQVIAGVTLLKSGEEI